ncbi:MAG: response regulator [Desulfobulbaceae bacterium]|uniref:Response regulator n=1 Tax=Candidatus Desulfatifera sulfidica TaxID=2841691 RepID=A0A8J6NBM8_9BACT|nr:response regulator [Candidatus Desulfatifera sulfidica]
MQKLKLLYVDDEPANLINFKISFKSRYEVLTADSAQEGLEIFQADPEIALVIADQRMPDMSGIAMLGAMRKINPDVVRIVLTGYTEVTDLIDAINKGEIFQYVIKPWDENEFLQILSQAEECYLLTREHNRTSST